MRKIFFICFACIIGVLTFAEENADDAVLQISGIGVMTPYYHVFVKGDGSRNTAGVLVSNMNIGIEREIGFTLKLDFAAGGLWIDSMPSTNEESVLGGTVSMDLGVGKSWIYENDSIFTICASFALLDYFFRDSACFEYNGEKLSDSSVSAIMLGLGIDAQFIKKIGNKAHFYTGVSAYYMLGEESIEFTASHNSTTYGAFERRFVYGGIAVHPTVGLCWQLN